MAGCVPKQIVKNLELTQHFPEEDVRKVVEKVGIYERRFADEKTCSSDLCYAAAERLIIDNNIDKEEIDVLIFITQTPDYRMPSNALLLQDRLGLSQKTIAFDITLGCSAFLYGLSVAFNFLNQPNIRKVLILDGETRSKVYSLKDRKTAFLFGDGGIAAIVERGGQFGNSYISLNSNGALSDTIKIDGGGYRNPSSEETIREKVVDEFGNVRSDEQGYMNGGAVFNFVSRTIPKDIKNLSEYSGIALSDVDYYMFHQANNYMNEYLVKKLKINPERVPETISKFGNTSSVSVPLTIVSELKDKLCGKHLLMLSSFGVGLTWGTAFLEFVDTKISDLVEI